MSLLFLARGKGKARYIPGFKGKILEALRGENATDGDIMFTQLYLLSTIQTYSYDRKQAKISHKSNVAHGAVNAVQLL